MTEKINKAKCVLLVAITLFFAACTEKDYYDPEFETDNPLGEVVAPASFDWSMTNSAQLNVTVNDEFDGQYYYSIEVFDQDPLNNKTAIPLAKGVAKQGMDFSTSLAITKDQKGIFIKQTDPKGRSVVRCYDYSKQINADFGTPIINTRAIGDQAVIEIPEVPQEYKNVPADAIVLENPGQNKELAGGKSYVLNNNYNGKIEYYSNGQNIKLYLANGVKWTIPTKQSIQAYLTVILTEGSSIEADDISFVNGSDLIINPTASLNTKSIQFTNDGSFVINWGELIVNDKLSMPNNNETKNYGTIRAGEIHLPNQSDFINDGNIEVSKITLNTNSKFTNNKSLIVNGKFELTNSGCVVTNNNHIKCTSTSFTNGILNNNCYFECEGLFYTNGFTINLNKGYVVAENMQLSGTKINFSKGSMIEAKTQIDHTSNASTYDGGSTERSLMKAPKIIGQGFTYQGNLTIESDTHVEKSKDWENYKITPPAELAGLGESTVFIEDCVEIRNGGNEGEEPEDPEFPIINTDGKSYTYLFEDQWPFYGDYDMNDVVINIKNITYTSNKNNLVEKYQFDFTLQAVGATKALAIATSLEKIDPNNIQSVSYSDKAPTSFNVNNGVETDQQTAVIPLIDHSHSFLGLSQNQFANTQSINVSNLPTVTVTVQFKEPVPAADLSINNFNLFIISDVNLISVNSNERKEIHVYGFAPTSKANTNYFGKNNDGSVAPRYYASNENLAWGIVVPESFKWSKEYTPLTESYTGFKVWLTSGGGESQDWYTKPDEGKVISLN